MVFMLHLPSLFPRLEKMIDKRAEYDSSFSFALIARRRTIMGLPASSLQASPIKTEDCQKSMVTAILDEVFTILDEDDPDEKPKLQEGAGLNNTKTKKQY
jgi:hypothetical protein